jgi:TonB-linked SusC/RagA family outer membrane protein
MQKILLSTCACLLIAWGNISAQNRTITGRVTSADDGAPLPGVNVVIKGTATGTVTDVNGDYTISAPQEGGVLVFSFIGLATQEIEIGQRNNIDVTLSQDVTQLGEVVVTAIGIEREKKALGYSVAQVNSDRLSQLSEPDPLRALTGKVAGVNIFASGGMPGQATNINIRGFSSLLGNNQPLFVVDGVPFDNSLFQTRATSAGTIADGAFSNRAVDLDPNNIESITILKGAAASVLYGSRAANGVVVVTTKSGRKNAQKGLEVQFNSSYSQEEIANVPDIQKVYSQGAAFEWDQGFVGSWGAPYTELGDGIMHPYDQPRFADVFPEFQGVVIPAKPVNNVERFFRTGHVFENALQITSGSDRTNITAGASHMTNNGIAINTSFRRTTVNFGGSAQLANKLFVTGNVNYVASNQESLQLGNSLGGNNTSILTRLMFTPTSIDLASLPYINPLDNSNVYYRNDQDNPFWLAHTSPFFSNVDRTYGNLALSYDFSENLKATYRVGFNAFTDRRLNVIAAGSAILPLGEIIEDDIYRQEIDALLNINYTKDFAERWSLSVNLGHNVNSRITDRQSILGTGIITFGIHDIDNTETQIANGGTFSERRLIGVFADVTLGFDDYIFLNLAARRDYSSTLPTSNRAYNYPAASLSVVLTDALKINSRALTFAKVRLSAATTGKDADPYLTQTTFVTNPDLGNGNLGLPFTLNGKKYNILSLDDQIGNQELSPEFTTEYEAGAELRFFNGRISADVAYFLRKSTDQIVNVTTPPSSGFTSMVSNLGEVENKGIEVALTAVPVELSNGLRWTMTHTFTRIRNKVIDLGDLDEIFLGGFTGLGLIHREGLPFGQIIGTDYLRDPETGMPLINGDNGLLIDNPEDQIIGDPTPDFQWTMNNTFTFRGVSLSFMLDWKKGGDQFCYNCGQMRARGVTTETVENRESPRVIPGFIADPADVTKPLLDENGQKIPNTYQISANDLYFIDGIASSGAFVHDTYDISTIRLREVMIGYTFPKKLLERTPFGSASISFSGRNLWYEAYNTPASLNYDPESTSINGAPGIDFGTAPSTKRYGVNLRLTF